MHSSSSLHPIHTEGVSEAGANCSTHTLLQSLTFTINNLISPLLLAGNLVCMLSSLNTYPLGVYSVQRWWVSMELKSMWAITIMASCWKPCPCSPVLAHWQLRFLAVAGISIEAAMVLWGRRNPSYSAKPDQDPHAGTPKLQLLLSILSISAKRINQWRWSQKWDNCPAPIAGGGALQSAWSWSFNPSK